MHVFMPRCPTARDYALEKMSIPPPSMHELSSNQAPWGPWPEGPGGSGGRRTLVAREGGGAGVARARGRGVCNLFAHILSPGLPEVRSGRKPSARFTAPKGGTKCARAATYGSGSLFSVVTIVPLAEKELYVPTSYIDFSNYP